MDKFDVFQQAVWEVELERFEKAVEEEKKRIRAKKAWFPWRFKIINVNKESK